MGAVSIRNKTGDRAQGVTHKFAETRHDTDYCCRRAQLGQEGSGDTAGAFIGQIRKEVGNSDDDQESERGRLPLICHQDPRRFALQLSSTSNRRRELRQIVDSELLLELRDGIYVL